jgi:hypothetical protein
LAAETSATDVFVVLRNSAVEAGQAVEHPGTLGGGRVEIPAVVGEMTDGKLDGRRGGIIRVGRLVAAPALEDAERGPLRAPHADDAPACHAAVDVAAVAGE